MKIQLFPDKNFRFSNNVKPLSPLSLELLYIIKPKLTHAIYHDSYSPIEELPMPPNNNSWGVNVCNNNFVLAMIA